MIDRNTLRQTLRAQRNQLSPSVQQHAAREICRSITNTTWFQTAQELAFYWSIRGEPDLHILLESAWKQGKNCYLPVCHPSIPNTLCFVPYRPGQSLVPNQYGIPEPAFNPEAIVPIASLDLVFTPLLAFDPQGNRLGSGKGYYDRTFAHLLHTTPHKPSLVGVAYSFQKVATLHPQPWDVPLDKAVAFDSDSQHTKVFEFAFPMA